jgi:hypothetical protein
MRFWDLHHHGDPWSLQGLGKHLLSQQDNQEEGLKNHVLYHYF